MKEPAVIQKKFVERTSCHGILEVYRSKNTIRRILWVVVVLFVLGMLIWQISERFGAYFKYSTTTQISEGFVHSLPFPAITICNFNRYFNVTEAEIEDLNLISFILDYGGPPNANQTPSFNELENFDSLKTIMTEYGWNLKEQDAILFCTLQGTDECTWEDFQPSLSYNLGLCWTLKVDASQIRAGKTHGFSAAFNVFQSNYTEDPVYGNLEAGIKFQVHDADEPPQVGAIGQSVGVGTWANVAIHKKETSRIYKPWGDCEPNNEELQFTSTYSLAACMNECFDKTVFETCGCSDPIMVRLGARECTVSEVINCTAPERTYLDLTVGPGDCGCSQPCREVTFDSTISYGAYPNEVAGKQLSNLLNLDSPTYLKENLVGISVYYDALTVTKMTNLLSSYAKVINAKNTKYNGPFGVLTYANKTGDVGGQLGLWIGISVVTIVEILQFIVDLLKTLPYFKKNDERREKNNSENGDQSSAM